MEDLIATENPSPRRGRRKWFLAVTCTLFLLYWMGDAFLTSYYSHYFIANGMDSTQQSILLGILPFALFLGCMVLSPLAKNSKRALRLFQICAAIEAGLSIGFAFCSSFWALLPMTFLLGFFNGAPFAFIEGYVAPRAKLYDVPYSFVRMFGTIGYVVSLILGYFILSKIEIRECYFIATALYLGGLAVSFLLGGKVRITRDGGKVKKSINYKEFFGKTLIFFLISQLFLYGAFNAMNYILPIRLKELGLADADYSLIRGIGMASELAMLLIIPIFGKKIRRYKTPILIASFVCLFASMMGMFVNNAYGLGYSALILSGVGKAFMFAYLALYLQDIVGAEALPETLTINTALTNLSSAVLNLISSAVYVNLGFPAYFGLISGLEVIGIVFVFLTKPKAGESTPAEQA